VFAQPGKDGNEFPDTGCIRDEKEKFRNWSPPIGRDAHFQFAKQAGQAEKQVLLHLNFNLELCGEKFGCKVGCRLREDLRCSCKQHGLDSRGHLLFASLKAIGISKYSDLWYQPYQEGTIVGKARELLKFSSSYRKMIQNAQNAIQTSIVYRQLDILAWRGVSRGHYPSSDRKEDFLRKGVIEILKEYHEDCTHNAQNGADDSCHMCEIDMRWKTFETLVSLLNTHANMPAHASPMNIANLQQALLDDDAFPPV